MRIRAFAFDLDETLADVEHHHGSATRALLAARQLAGVDLTPVLADVTGKRTRDVMDLVRAHLKLPEPLDDLLHERHHAFRAALRETPPVPLPGARAVVDAAAARGPVALVTSGFREDALGTLEALELRDRFSAFITGEDVANPKPDPEPYRAAADAMGVPAGAVLAFEDSVRGAMAARAAGCRVVAIPNPRNTRAEDVAPHADVVLASLTEADPFDAFLARLSGGDDERASDAPRPAKND